MNEIRGQRVGLDVHKDSLAIAYAGKVAVTPWLRCGIFVPGDWR